MIKLLGAALLTFGSLLLGLCRAAELEKRARTLRQLTKALELMQSEICTRLTPLPELFEKLARELPAGAGSFFAGLSARMPGLGEKALGELWAEAAENTPELPLREEEKNELRLLGLSVGRYDGEGQRAALEGAAARFAEFSAKAQEEAKAGKRLYSGLGLACGLMLAIILL